MNKLTVAIIVIICVLAGAFFVWTSYGPASKPLPSAQVYESPKATVTPKVSPSTSSLALPEEINLSVPFTVQAPHANWEDPYGDFCEEASVFMAANYIKHLTISGPNYADREMLKIKAFEEERFGYHKDTTAEETATILREFYKIEKVKVVYDPSENDIKKALSEKKAVIIPAAGRQLGNPYFRPPGPLYHMLVIKGYTKDGDFITNDPGTKRGENFIYSPSIIMNAIHDWNGGDVDSGRKVIILVG